LTVLSQVTNHTESGIESEIKTTGINQKEAFNLFQKNLIFSIGDCLSKCSWIRMEIKELKILISLRYGLIG